MSSRQTVRPVSAPSIAGKSAVPAHTRWYFIIVVLVVQLRSAEGQWAPGSVTFANNAASPVINGRTGLPVELVDGVQVALYWAPTGSSEFVQLGKATDVALFSRGIFVDGSRTTGIETVGGTAGQFQLRAWADGYPSFEQALGNPGTLIGRSKVFQLLTGAPSGDPPTPPRSLGSGGFGGFVLAANSGPLRLHCGTNRAIPCHSAATFTPPTVDGGCRIDLQIREMGTTTSNSCPKSVTRNWQATDACGNSATCSQTIFIVCPECLVLTAQSAGDVVELSWASLTNAFYQIQYRTNLFSGSWQQLGTPIPGNGSIQQVKDRESKIAPQRFYRLVRLEN